MTGPNDKFFEPASRAEGTERRMLTDAELAEVAVSARRTAMLLLRNVSDAEDVAQDVTATLCIRGVPVELGSLLAYTSRIVQNATYTYIARRRSNLVSSTSISDFDNLAIPSSETPVDNRIVLTQLLGRLPHRQRQALHARYLLEMNLDEVAAYLGVTRNTAKSLLRTGLQNLRTTISQDPSE